ncbi:MAG: 3-dehydroquinate synthase [Acidobacteria bacterium]|nr:3-dehydroquinate synthase [Acidobacteriota bacterium]
MRPFLTIRQASATYPVFVGRELLDHVGSAVAPRGKVFVITTAAQRERFGDRVAASFQPVADMIVMEEGEAHKTLATADAIVTNLLEHGAKRDSLAVVVGGGMIGDTAGFAASIFLRGIGLVQVPTTLLAQVDSSIGGKVAVNHPKGKNLIGSFHPPRAVVCDTSVLGGLPRRELLSGVFEALKGGVLGDPTLFEQFEAQREAILALDHERIDDVVRRAIKVKADIVSADEREDDVRRLLNYGHTIAHGIEAALAYQGLTHGEAVAWGMIGANAMAVRRGLLDGATRARIDDAIRAYEPRRPAGLDPAAVLKGTEHDKKNTGSSRVMVFPRAIGRCEVVTGIGEDELRYGIEAALAG